MKPLFDSHCHINDESLNVEEVIKNALEANVNFLLCLGWNLDSSKEAIKLANKYEEVYAAVGIHPENYLDQPLSSLLEIKELAKEKKVIAIGEVGLDYHWKNDEETKKKQKEYFIKQIELANELHLPLSIHARDASNDLYEILKTHQILNGFVLHCYSSSLEMMEKFISLGAYFGFDGPITYKNAITPKECVKACPLDRLLIETDSPYLSPVPYRGKTNQPSYVKEVFKMVALLKEIDEEKLSEILNQNLERLFRVKR